MTDATMAALEKMTLDELKPGDFLPSEVRLSETLGVSRLTIREATRALVAKGYLEIRQGRRPLVLQPNGSLLSDYFAGAIRRDPSTLLELLEVRMALEVQAARLAAAHVDADQVQTMEEALGAMDAAASVEDEDAFHTADIRFHEALAAASSNRMLLQIIQELAEPLMQSRRQSYQGHRRTGRDLAPVVEQHRAVLAAVRASDADGAGESMRQHLDSTASDLRAAMTADEATP